MIAGPELRARRTPAGVRAVVPHATRYAIAGVVVGLTYVGLTLGLSGPVGLPIQLGIPFALVTAGALHFVLQRTFVFRDRDTFALSGTAQARRYVVIATVQYAFTATATAVMPDVLGISERAVYVGAVAIVSSATFLFMRSRVFHVA